MPRFKIITKKDCFFCDKLKIWLSSKDVDLKEIDYLDPKNNDDPIMKNEMFMLYTAIWLRVSNLFLLL